MAEQPSAMQSVSADQVDGFIDKLAAFRTSLSLDEQVMLDVLVDLGSDATTGDVQGYFLPAISLSAGDFAMIARKRLFGGLSRVRKRRP